MHAEPTTTPTLAEDLLLLAWSERTGMPLMATGVGLDAAIAGALVLELTMLGHLTIVDGKPVVDDQATGVPLLDEVVATIRRGPARRSLEGWVRRLGTARRRREVRAALVASGALVPDRRRLLGLVPLPRYAVADQARVERLSEHARAVLRGQREPDERTAALLSLAGACGAVDHLVERGERRDARRRAIELGETHAASEATRAVVQEAQAALVAVIAATTSAKSSS